MSLSNAGCDHHPIITGSGRKAALNPAFKWVNTCAPQSREDFLALAGLYRPDLRPTRARLCPLRARWVNAKTGWYYGRSTSSIL
jgi:hypothetical protein